MLLSWKYGGVHAFAFWKKSQVESNWKSFSRVRLFRNPMNYTVHGILQARILA